MNNLVDRAKERAGLYGTEAATLEDTLRILLGKGVPEETIRTLSETGPADLHRMTEQEILSMDGITKNRLLIIRAAFHLGDLLAKDNPEGYIIRSPQDAADYVMKEMANLDKEHFVLICLNTKNKVIRKKTLHIGGLNSSIVDRRFIFKEALSCSAASIIVSHNHPSKNPSESQEDRDVTRAIGEAGKLIGVELIDHIIVGGDKFISLKEKGYL
jgi:DNA repair protein RadC